MKYLNLDIDIKGNDLTIHEPDSFTPSHIFENGQCFRWNRIADEHYFGIAGGRAAEVKKIGRDIVISNAGIEDLKDFWYEYFDFGRDYGRLKERISIDDLSRRAVVFGEGLRILRQDFFETLVSFIISQNNNIPRIMKIIDSICTIYGKEIRYKGETYHAFPGRDDFIGIRPDDLSFCRAGYRCGYLSELSGSSIPERESLMGSDLAQQRRELMKIAGVGPKVADCVLLFSGINVNAVPVDVWIKKIMKNEYQIEGGVSKVRGYFLDRFDYVPGIAQQYLFYYARNNL